MTLSNDLQHGWGLLSISNQRRPVRATTGENNGNIFTFTQLRQRNPISLDRPSAIHSPRAKGTPRGQTESSLCFLLAVLPSFALSPSNQPYRASSAWHRMSLANPLQIRVFSALSPNQQLPPSSLRLPGFDRKNHKGQVKLKAIKPTVLLKLQAYLTSQYRL